MSAAPDRGAGPPPPVLSSTGRSALRALMRGRPLLAFDFDGTLAPIVARPDQARILPEVAATLQRLAALHPVAVVSGRALQDLVPRLGFAPQAVAGSHGAEDPADPGGTAHRVAALQPARALLARHAGALAAAGVTVEDKGASIALHHRAAPDPAAAVALLQRLALERDERWSVFGGKAVLNLVARGAPDKADAVAALVRRFGADAALFAGDDVNDEPVFAGAPPHWVTVRVGEATGSHAAAPLATGACSAARPGPAPDPSDPPRPSHRPNVPDPRPAPPPATAARFTLEGPQRMATLLRALLRAGGGPDPGGR